MHIQVSAKEATPIYLQIVEQVRRLIACGELTEGEELPSIRGLADQLIVNPNTVARAYRELELAGLVAIRRSTYTYVAASPSVAAGERLSLLRNQVDALVADARQMRLPLQGILELVSLRYAETTPIDDMEVPHVRRD